MTNRKQNAALKRLFGIVYFLVVGIPLGILVFIIGSLYGIVGTVLRLADFGGKANADTWTRRPIYGPAADVVNWWSELVYYAVIGRPGLNLAPDIGGA